MIMALEHSQTPIMTGKQALHSLVMQIVDWAKTNDSFSVQEPALLTDISFGSFYSDVRW